MSGGLAIEAAADVNFHRILIAIDRSDASRNALAVGLSLAAKYDATAILAHVVSSVDVYTRSESEDFDASGREFLDRAARSAQAHEVTSEIRLLHGEAVDQLLHVSADAEVDLVVMGTNGRQGFARFYVGSVADGVLRRSSVPVLIVRASLIETDQVG